MYRKHVMKFLPSVVLLHYIFLEGVRLDPGLKLPPSLHILYINKLATWEKKLYESLVGHNDQSSPIANLEEYLADYRNSSVAEPLTVFEHPLLTYRMLYRVTKYLPSILERIGGYHEKPDDFEFPGDDGLFMGSVAVLELQFSYNFSAAELIDGRFGSVQTTHGLTHHHGLQLVKHGLEVGFYVQIWSWLSVLERLLPNNAHVQAMKDRTILEHDDTYRVKKTRYCFTKPLAEGPSPPLFQTQIAEMFLAGLGSGLQLERSYVAHSLCSNSTIAPKPKSQFNCWNDHSSHSYFAINPLKTELLLDSPPIYQFHEIVGERWIRRTVTAAIPGLMKNAVVVNPAINSGQMSFTFLNETELSMGTRVRTKLERVLGMKLAGKGGDDYRISVYHTGGDGALHTDAFRTPNGRHLPHFFADRLGTLMIYLSNPELGGETVFPDISLKVRPVRGSGLFWTHYKRNGKMNWKSWHKPCPTVLGSRWFLSIFVMKDENMFTYKCSKVQDE